MIWPFLHQKIKQDIDLVLLCVLESDGSSPGRQGFKMVVAADGEMKGSIGGGIMEQKWVALAQTSLQEKKPIHLIKKQVHRKNSLTDRSGLICSGEQTVFLYSLQSKDRPVIEQLAKQPKGSLCLGPKGVEWHSAVMEEKAFVFHFKSEEDWRYMENLEQRDLITIVGAGHVGCALSRMMVQLGFYVKLLDDRPGLNTMEQNDAAQEKIVINYEQIAEVIPANVHHYVVIMTFGYRSDKIVLKQLLGKPFRYLGMMGSDAKIKQLFAELLAEGHSDELLKRVKAPIGLAIYSKTPEEIAVSIAAEIIKIKNQHLPTGRKEREAEK